MGAQVLLTLVTVLAVSLASDVPQVSIRYSDPILGFTLPLINRGVRAVAFHYSVKNVEYTGRGVQTSTGWQYLTREVSLDGADKVTAYAVIFDIYGNERATTELAQLLLGDTSVVAARLPARRIRGAVIFRDDFNSFNSANWNYEVSMYGGYNWEFQVYTNDPKNVFTRDGQLYLKPTLTVDDPRFDENYLHTGKMDVTQIFGYCTEAGNYGCVREGKYGLLPPVMSGKLKSKPTIRYGVVEVRARIPRGDWIWPALWMMPKYSRYGNWPRSGEIDIMESRGNSGDIGVGHVSSTLHWGPSPGENRYQMTTGQRKSSSWANSFHTWRLEWTPDHLVTYVDNQQIMYVTPGSSFWSKGGFGGSNLWAGGEKMAPFDQEFYMIMNVAVGGTNGFFPDGNYYGVRKPWANSSPHAAEDFWNARGDWGPTWQGDNTAMIVDYIEFRHL